MRVKLYLKDNLTVSEYRRILKNDSHVVLYSELNSIIVRIDPKDLSKLDYDWILYMIQVSSPILIRRPERKKSFRNFG